jgi:hypothetical protein
MAIADYDAFLFLYQTAVIIHAHYWQTLVSHSLHSSID